MIKKIQCRRKFLNLKKRYNKFEMREIFEFEKSTKNTMFGKIFEFEKVQKI